MRKLINLFLLNLLFLLFVGCSEEGIMFESLDSNDDVSLKNARVKHYVPFKGTFEVYVDKVIPYPPPPPKIQEVLGIGNVTHLGKTEVFIEQKWWPPHPPPLIPPWTGTGIGEIVFTAANGDILLAYYEDAVSFHESYTDVYVTLTGHFKNGGTGRFENAEGSFIWEVIFYPLTNEGTVTLTGEIKYGK
ncbi:MAG: hypothetical protein ABFR32_01315 [Bacteroidota bacterium]